MLEHQLKVSKHESMPAGYVPILRSGSESFNLWMHQMDITSYDFPYIKSLLQESYLDWQEQVSSLPIMEKLVWGLLHCDGSWIEGDASIQSYMSQEGQSIFARCLTDKTEIRAHWQGNLGDDHSEHMISMIPLFTKSQQELYAVMVVIIPEQVAELGGVSVAIATSLHFQACFYKRFEYIFVSDVMNAQIKEGREASRRSILFQIVQRLHDQIDVDTVLTEVLDSIEILYPTATLQLFMSQDHQSSNPRVKPLILSSGLDDVRIQTFMEGCLTRQESTLSNGAKMMEIGIPFGGKQGVYGVFLLQISKEFFAELDLQLVTTLVDTAGSAFENAKLYEQSNLLIQELKHINQLTKLLNQSLQLNDIYQSANEEMLNIFKADYCCILQFNETIDGLEVQSCNVPSLEKDIFAKDYGFSGLVYTNGEPLILSDYLVNLNVSSKFMEDTGSSSLIASPLTIKGEVTGVILLSHEKSHYFSYDNYRLLQTLANHIGLAVSNALLHAEVRRMACRDVLTDLYARHYLDEVIREKMINDYCGCLVVVDIDEFKQVNDKYGHQKGDKILKKVSEIIKTSIRKSDTPARWGGEELAIYLPQMSIKQGLIVSERIRRRVEEETNPSVTISIGISEWNWLEETVSVDSLFYRADMALYRAKNNGRNQIQVEDRRE
ncbi:sensor domain-containing diguanylate cyclase [Paenibacillus sp. IHBB 10380]|uniref:sensor domain-containing diguanylate cyclase n=1 Tax=Paenibacillus sp. IHBB 10380 TaxID=1566358 RepID=UPI0005CFACAA|nr:sensor domain-containing diguanylate cyclase [Paenibacillus sp. IHBB 10380]AJS57835.1 diguanylate cyclase [Paenibacillus sp. IHBB 10380]